MVIITNWKHVVTTIQFGLAQMQQMPDMRIQLHYYYYYFYREKERRQEGEGGTKKGNKKRIFRLACSWSCQHLK